jgi:hypothetical protein
MKRLTALLMTMLALTANAEVKYGLKGFTPGTKMTSCPAKWEAERKGSTLVCSSRSETLAGGPVALFELELFKGRLVSINAYGVEQIQAVEIGLVAKFGMPAPESTSTFSFWPMEGASRMSLSRKSAHVGVDDKNLFEEMKKAAQQDI